MLNTALGDPGCIPPSVSKQILIKTNLKDSHSSNALEIGRRVENPFLINVNGNGLNEIKYCATCKIYRPPNQTSHCRQCNVCIKGADHHCKWLGTCIGRRNYREFFLFTFFLMLYSFLVSIACLVYWTAKASTLAPSPHNFINNAHMWNVMRSSPLILPLSLYALCATVLAGVLFFYHLLYVVGGATTTASLVKHEKTLAWRHSPWDHMKITANLEQMLFSRPSLKPVVEFHKFITTVRGSQKKIEIVQ